MWIGLGDFIFEWALRGVYVVYNDKRCGIQLAVPKGRGHENVC